MVFNPFDTQLGNFFFSFLGSEDIPVKRKGSIFIKLVFWDKQGVFACCYCCFVVYL